MTEGATSSARVLSIQSTVVHGYVGNKSAVFPLQTLGIEVDPINSVQFSNHTGYPIFTGHTLDGPQLKELVRGLTENGLIDHTHLLTGYMKSPSILRTVVETLRLLREKNPNTTYFCDPVMGDNGELYVPEELVPVYRDEVVPLATVLTPNQFEAETLTGVTITSDGDAVTAMDRLHAQGVKIVVITSCVYGSPDSITLVASRAGQESQGGGRAASRSAFPRSRRLLPARGICWQHCYLHGWISQTI